MIQCIRSSSWIGYVLVKVRHDLPEAGFVKVPRNDRGSIRVFVNVSAEHIVAFGQSQVSACGGMYTAVTMIDEISQGR